MTTDEKIKELCEWLKHTEKDTIRIFGEGLQWLTLLKVRQKMRELGLWSDDE